MKGMENVEIVVVWGLAVTQKSPAMSPFSRAPTLSYSSIWNHASVFYKINL